jgi:subtilisin family serine protease
MAEKLHEEREKKTISGARCGGKNGSCRHESHISETNIAQVRASDLWPFGYQGQAAVVALMDTGADVNHPDLAGRWRGGTNSWFDPFFQYTEPHDGDPDTDDAPDVVNGSWGWLPASARTSISALPLTLPAPIRL